MLQTDLGVHAAVSRALRTTLGAVAPQVTVTVLDGVVTVIGTVPTSATKLTVEQTVQRVGGVHAVVERLRVAGTPVAETTDESLARAAVQALDNGLHPVGRDVIVRVEDGWLILTGSVGSTAEYAAVERALECLEGARGMRSELRVVPAGGAGSRDTVAFPTP